jgi:precorrin-6A/cobalt-precorrin-6A reductase
MKRILLLGGVTEALAIARTLGRNTSTAWPASAGCRPICLPGAGRRLRRRRRAGAVHAREGIDLLIDATHPTPRRSATTPPAPRADRHPCWALRRPAWQPQAGMTGAKSRLGRTDRGPHPSAPAVHPRPRAAATPGRNPAQQFWTLRALDVYPGNERCEVIGARGPFLIEDERALFERRQIDV